MVSAPAGRNWYALLLVVCALSSCESPEEKIIAEIDRQILSRKASYPQEGGETAKISGVVVVVEWFEVRGGKLDEFLQATAMGDDAEKLRREVQIWSRLGDAQVLETAVARAKNGASAKISSAEAMQYPDKYTRAKLTTAEDSGGSKKTMMALTSTNLRTHRAGTNLEIKPVLREDGSVVVDLSSEFSRRLPDQFWDEESEGVSGTVYAPRFFRNTRESELTAGSGLYYLLGSTPLPEEARNSEWSDAVLVTFARVDAW